MQQLLKELEDVKEKLILSIKAYPEEKRFEATFNDWTLKDLVAHMSAWNIQRVKELKLFQNKEPIEKINDFDSFNRETVSDRKNKPWDFILEEFIQSCESMLEEYRNIEKNRFDEKIWLDSDHTPKKWLETDLKHWRNHLEEIASN